MAALWPLSAYAINPVLFPTLAAMLVLGVLVAVRPAYGLAAALALAPLTNLKTSVGGSFAKPFHILLPALIFLTLAYGLLVARRRVEVTAWAVPTAVLVFGAAALIASLRALDPSASVTKVFLLLSATALYFAVLQVCREPADLTLVVGGAIAGLLIAGIQGLEQRYGGLHGAVGFLAKGRFVARVQGSFGHPNQYGGFLAALLPVAIAVAASRAFPARLRLLSGIATAASVPALAFSYARGAILALVIAAVLVLAVLRPWLAVVVGIVVAVAAIALAPPALQERFDPRASKRDVPLRTDIWGGALDIYTAHPITGVGVGNFPRAYAMLPGTLAHASQRRLLNQHGLLIPPHAQNQYLNVMAEEGIIGLAALGFLLVAAGRLAFEGRHLRDPAGRVVTLAFGATLLTVMLHGVLEVTLFTELAFPFYALLGAATVYMSRRSENSPEAPTA